MQILIQWDWGGAPRVSTLVSSDDVKAAGKGITFSEARPESLEAQLTRAFVFSSTMS